MKSVLFVATIHKHFLAFHIPYIKMLKDNGYKVYCAAYGLEKVPYVDGQFNISVRRNPFDIRNIKAVMQLKKIISEYKINLVHCHTAMGAVITRLAARKFRKDKSTKVLYTVHGFHFFKGAPFYYWMLYFPIEKFLSRYTDGLILINSEDYNLVQKYKFKNINTFLINGIGVNIERFRNITYDECVKKRTELCINENDVVLIYIAEFIKRKNHIFLINNVKNLLRQHKNIKLLLAGRGRLYEKTKDYIIKNNLESNIIMLGFRKDISDLISISDIGISVSKQEGLPMNVAEEMYMGLPMVVSNIRGNRDLVKDKCNGFLFDLNDREKFNFSLETLIEDESLRKQMSKSSKHIVQNYLLPVTIEQMKYIYSLYL